MLITKHTIHIKHTTIHQTIACLHIIHNNHTTFTTISMLYTQSHIKHSACSVLVLSRDFLGNHIPNHTIHIIHTTIHQTITCSHIIHNNHTTFTIINMLYTQSHIKHSACSVLVLSRDFLGNHIPKPNIEPHQVVIFLHLNNFGLDPNPSSPR